MPVTSADFTTYFQSMDEKYGLRSCVIDIARKSLKSMILWIKYPSRRQTKHSSYDNRELPLIRTISRPFDSIFQILIHRGSGDVIAYDERRRLTFGPDWSTGPARQTWAPRSARSALSATAILADRKSLLSPSAADVRRPAEPLKLSASCLAPLLVNAEKLQRAIVRVTRTQEPAEEAVAADEEKRRRRRWTRTRRGTGGPEKHRGGPSIISGWAGRRRRLAR